MEINTSNIYTKIIDINQGRDSKQGFLVLASTKFWLKVFSYLMQGHYTKNLKYKEHEIYPVRAPSSVGKKGKTTSPKDLN